MGQRPSKTKGVTENEGRGNEECVTMRTGKKRGGPDKISGD